MIQKWLKDSTKSTKFSQKLANKQGRLKTEHQRIDSTLTQVKTIWLATKLENPKIKMLSSCRKGQFRQKSYCSSSARNGSWCSLNHSLGSSSGRDTWLFHRAVGSPAANEQSMLVDCRWCLAHGVGIGDRGTRDMMWEMGGMRIDLGRKSQQETGLIFQKILNEPMKWEASFWDSTGSRRSLVEPNPLTWTE